MRMHAICGCAGHRERNTRLGEGQEVFAICTRGAQGRHGGVRQDVNASGLPGSRAQSAVFLVHAESPRQAQGGQVQWFTAERLQRFRSANSGTALALRKRMLSHGECERLVTPATYQCRTGRRLEKSSVHGRRPGISWGCGILPATSGCEKTSVLSLTSIQVAVSSPRFSFAPVLTAKALVPAVLASKAICASRSTCRFEIWKAMTPPGARCLL